MSNLNNALELMPQWVCLQCGYNMIGEMPDKCPFCGADNDRFMHWDEIERNYSVTSFGINFGINNNVSQLLSVPKLGLEHAAYRIETDQGKLWIDAPSAFNRDLDPVDAILFTHRHFMGASNQYRRLWHSQVWLHELDANHKLAAPFDIDQKFKDDFRIHGIEAFHIGGHTPGFTIYMYNDLLFICDYVFWNGSTLSFNPYGPEQETKRQALCIYEAIKTRRLTTVCGYNYVIKFDDWFIAFKNLISMN